MHKQSKLETRRARPSSDAVDSRMEWELQPNRLLRLKGAGIRVTCLEGVLLITAYDQAEDITLRAGDVFVVRNDGLALIESIVPSRMHIALPRDGILLSREGAMRMLKQLGTTMRPGLAAVD